VKEISRISDTEAAEGKVTDIYTSSTSGEDRTAEVLKKISPLPSGKLHRLSSRQMHTDNCQTQ
jgi:hypothetical protein